MTGVRGESVQPDQQIKISGRSLPYTRTFSQVAPGHVFWHVNAHGLVELSINQGNVADMLGLDVGQTFNLG